MSRVSSRTARLVPAVLLALCWARPASAQSVTARVEGVVTDTTGATVPGATVTATNTNTNAARSAATRGDGSYVVTNLAPGPYRVTVDLPGFKPAATNVTLSVNQVARLDLKLELGTQTEVVEVTGVAPVIEKDTSAIGTVIDEKQIANLPLNGRNFTQLATLSPGVTRGTPGSVASGVNGNTETFRYGEVGGGALSVNGVREQFNNFMLDGVDNNESLVNAQEFFPSVEGLQEFRVITTNAQAEFGRAGGAVVNLITKSGTNQLHGSAFEFNRNEALDAKPTFVPRDQEKPDFSRNEFGATLGGPIVKDKTFFFVSYKGVRDKIPVEAGGKVTVPTAKMRNGDFSELLNPSFTGLGQTIIISEPVAGQPFAGNIIPPGRIDPVGQRYLNLFPMPDVATSYQQNYFTHRQRKSDFDDVDARIDHVLGASDTLFLRGSFADDHRFDPGRIPGYQAGFGSGTAAAKGFQVALGETHTFSQRVVNELRLAFTSYRFEFLPVGFGDDQNRAVGIPGPGGITVGNGISLVGGGNGSWIEYLGDFGQYRVPQKTLQLSDALTLVRGSHTLKAGLNVINRRVSFERSQIGKGFYFFSDFTATPGNVPPAGQTGFEVSDMLIGKTAFTAAGVPGYVPRTTISWENSAFLQDDWRVSRRLTLNLGLRYDVFTPYYEKDDKLANFDPATGRLVLAGKDGVPRSTVDTDWNNLGPRAGFAYLLNDKTVIRGAYGIFYSLDRGGVDNQLSENPPAVVTEYRFDGPFAHVRLSEPIPLPTAVDPNNPQLPQGSGLVYVPRDTKTTRIQQFSLGAQREITRTTAVTLAYVGTRGDNLTAVTSVAGFSGGITGRLTTVQNIAESSYDSLQMSLRRSAATGLNYLAAYTWGHALNDSPGPFPGNASSFRSTPTDARNLGLDKGNADYDVRHRFTFAATYPLPFLKDNRILGGWSVNGIVTLQSGTPFSVYAGDFRADRVAGKDPNDGPRTVERWFDTSAFVARGKGEPGGRNTVYGPGIKTLDLSLFKSFKVAGRTNLELRIEGFNVTNTPQYEMGAQFIDNANFGRIQSTRLNSERQIQLAARLTF